MKKSQKKHSLLSFKPIRVLLLLSLPILFNGVLLKNAHQGLLLGAGLILTTTLFFAPIYWYRRAGIADYAGLIPYLCINTLSAWMTYKLLMNYGSFSVNHGQALISFVVLAAALSAYFTYRFSAHVYNKACVQFGTWVLFDALVSLCVVIAVPFTSALLSHFLHAFR